jgi:hypothetical protein
MAKGADLAGRGSLAERIVANELGFQGFRVTSFNKEGVEADTDLHAAK